MIVLRAKSIVFQVTYIDLSDKPDWFLKISPHGKVPVLLVDGAPLFESNAIAEYLDEAVAPRLHSEDAVKRARNRAWTDYIPDFSSQLGSVYYAGDEQSLREAIDKVRPGLAKLEDAIGAERGNDGPYFNGDRLCLVDCAYAPFFQRYVMTEQKLRTSLLSDTPLVSAWVDALLAHPAVIGSVADSFEQTFFAGLKNRGALAA